MLETLKSLSPVLIGSVLTFAATSFWNNRASKKLALSKLEDERKMEAEKLAAEKAELTKQLVEMQIKLNTIGDTVKPITAAFQAFLVNKLTHTHEGETDVLLAKLDPMTLTMEEEIRLLELLKEREQDFSEQITAQEREAARVLPYIITMVRHERDLAAAVANVAIVAMTIKDELRQETHLKLEYVVVYQDGEPKYP